jgi:chorismate mutase
MAPALASVPALPLGDVGKHEQMLRDLRLELDRIDEELVTKAMPKRAEYPANLHYFEQKAGLLGLGYDWDTVQGVHRPVIIKICAPGEIAAGNMVLNAKFCESDLYLHDTLAKRMRLHGAIAEEKLTLGMETRDPSREIAVIQRVLSLNKTTRLPERVGARFGSMYGFPEEIVEDIYREIIMPYMREQQKQYILKRTGSLVAPHLT